MLLRCLRYACTVGVGRGGERGGRRGAGGGALARNFASDDINKGCVFMDADLTPRIGENKQGPDYVWF